ncbi:MAG: type II toxin-antitoxin system VapB family antitoxin [Bdellovibrionales bacterium]
MRTTVTLDDELLEKAMQAHDITSKSELLNKLLKEDRHRQASIALANMHGFDPDAKFPDRRSHWERYPNWNDEDEQ